MVLSPQRIYMSLGERSFWTGDDLAHRSDILIYNLGKIFKNYILDI